MFSADIALHSYEYTIQFMRCGNEQVGMTRVRAKKGSSVIWTFQSFTESVRVVAFAASGTPVRYKVLLNFCHLPPPPPQSPLFPCRLARQVQTLDIHGKRVRCQIWDTAGQEKFHVITRAYYRGAHGIALAYDVTDGDSFKNVNYWWV